jgi:hypothetical protein
MTRSTWTATGVKIFALEAGLPGPGLTPNPTGFVPSWVLKIAGSIADTSATTNPQP